MRFSSSSLVVVAAALVAAATSPAFAQTDRLSTAERLERLEARAATGAIPSNAGSQLELLSQIEALRSELQSLRATVEIQGNELDRMSRRLREQAVDIDARVAKLEGKSPRPLADIAASDAEPATARPDAPPARPGQLALESAEPVADPFSADPQPRADTLADDELAAEPAATNGDDRDPSVTTERPRTPPTGISDAAPADPADERASYESAFDALKDGRYAESARRFQNFIERFPRGDYAPNAYYWLGESYYVTQNYAEALATFEGLLERFPDSTKAPDALLKSGYCHYEMRQHARAEAVLREVVQRYPDTTVSRLADGRLRALELEQL